MSDEPYIKRIAQNRKARFEYFVLDSYEAGIVLQGTEVKSLRAGKVNFSDCYALVEAGEVFIIGLHISEYTHGNMNNHDPLRKRKLLLQKKEIRKVMARVAEKGLTLVPLQIYFKDGKVKLEIAVAKGKKLYDKREAIAERDRKREQERSFNKD